MRTRLFQLQTPVIATTVLEARVFSLPQFLEHPLAVRTMPERLPAMILVQRNTIAVNEGARLAHERTRRA